MTDYAQARTAMVDCQVRPSDVTSYAIIEAMLSVPREAFVPRSWQEIAYADAEIDLGSGRMMMAPRTFAKMLEAAQINKNDLVLDLAPGTGYSSAVIARLAGAVVAREWDGPLASRLESAIASQEIDNVLLSTEETDVGDPSNGPYDLIFVNCGIEELPEELIGQLKEGGRLVGIFMNGAVGQCRVRIRTGDVTSDRYVFDASADVPPAFRRTDAFAL